MKTNSEIRTMTSEMAREQLDLARRNYTVDGRSVIITLDNSEGKTLQTVKVVIRYVAHDEWCWGVEYDRFAPVPLAEDEKVRAMRFDNFTDAYFYICGRALRINNFYAEL